ncbi:MGDG synthase family glycosyltransferase [Caldalkalibacillus salinus]|uniref:MGDG synthase family glycosyltransferase n=1 Tax=Caldalkalibacillus salinus TaxID=2803787 RepID=UPI001924011C|nr:glycosyltransferase [Caldalkalibacillus salinus]
MSHKILVFTEQKVGEGHFQAAKSIQLMLNNYQKGQVDVQLVSGMNAVHPFLEWLLITGYFTLIKTVPFLWKWMYLRTTKCSVFHRHFFKFRLKKLLHHEKPDIVLFTHPSCVSAVCEIRKNSKNKFKLGAIFTDYGFHPFFIHTEMDYYFVAHEKIKKRLINNYGIQAECIYDYGIPVHSDFEHTVEEPNVIPFRNPHQFHILILGGATGYGPIQKLVHVLRSQRIPYHITVITGKNQRLYRKLRRKNDESTVVLGYVTNMKYWMERADVIITKPGGLTVSEAIRCGTPIVTINPIPGHEEANERFLHEHRIGVPVKDISLVPYYIRKWLIHPYELQEWRERIKNFQKPNAALRIVQTLLEQTK